MHQGHNKVRPCLTNNGKGNEAVHYLEYTVMPCQADDLAELAAILPECITLLLQLPLKELVGWSPRMLGVYLESLSKLIKKT